MTRKKAPGSSPRANRTKRTIGMLIGGGCVVAVCILGRYYMLGEPASADWPGSSLLSGNAGQSATDAGASNLTSTPPRQPAGRTAPATAPGSRSPLKVVATVNGEDITRNELAQECLRHYGTVVLEHLCNRCLIQEECKRRNISVTRADVNAEIERLATGSGLSVEHLLNLIKEERGMKPEQYAGMVWQLLTIRKLAGARLEVTQEELAECFERDYGEAVQARMIVCDDRKTAEEVRAEAAARPDEFGRLAKTKSVDDPSASLNGRMPLIRKHGPFQQIEQAAFQMADGEVSEVIPVAGQYVILKREGLRPAVKVAFEQVKMQMVEKIRKAKSERVAHETLRELQEQANVENVLNDAVKSRHMPGVAAVVNGRRITVRELAEACIEWHGEEVVEGTINRRLLEQALSKRKITITEDDLDREIARAASQYLRLKPDGSPDVEKWIAMKTQDQGISVDIYRTDEVWPSVALKKLVGEEVEVTEEDLRKGYEADFGPRVRCLAIVLSDLRLAYRVWKEANQNPTKEHFGDLAQTYSVEPGSRALRGEVSPIQKHRGQPKLEEEAFSLQPGELSQVIHVGGNRYVILLCEGYTKPVGVDFAEVRDEIYADLHELKLRVAMANCYQQLKENATIDNYLAGTVHSPNRSARLRTGARSPAPRRTSSRR